VSEVTSPVTVVDANVVAYLVLRGYVAIPFIKSKSSEGQSARVAWDVQGSPDAIDREMKKYYANEKVGIMEYVRILKDIRGEMYQIKSIRGQLRDSNP